MLIFFDLVRTGLRTSHRCILLHQSLVLPIRVLLVDNFTVHINSDCDPVSLRQPRTSLSGPARRIIGLAHVGHLAVA